MPVEILSISDPDDPGLHPYRAIRERDLVGRDGVFIAEGKVVLETLVARPDFRVRSILVLNSRLPGLSRLLDTLDDVQVYVADQTVFDAVAGFHVHRGVLAVASRSRGEPEADALLKAVPDRGVVLCAIGLSNHDNVGALFRNAAAFGAAAILLDKSCCDPFYRKAIRVSTGSVFRVPFARVDSGQDMIALLARHRIKPVALSPQGRDELSASHADGAVALLLGTEGEGLPKTLMDQVTTARISLSGDVDSLNVATAAAVALDRLTRR